MRATVAAVSALFILVPSIAFAQKAAGTGSDRFSLQAAAGRTLNDPGSDLSAAAGFSPERHVDLLINVERMHQPTRDQSSSGGVSSTTRGGTLTFVSGEVRAAFRPPDDASPFVLAGFGAGRSEPNVNAQFPAAARHGLRAVYAGAGFRIPLGEHAALLADARLLLGIEEGTDGLTATWPVRVGVVWRF